jgi:peptidoglycan hydrolase CwlO-like protein
MSNWNPFTKEELAEFRKAILEYQKEQTEIKEKYDLIEQKLKEFDKDLEDLLNE